MNTIFFALFFLGFGLIIGSFLNVVVLRLERGMTLGGRSLCPSCKEMIRWYDNIPLLSFLLLRGRCRYCRSTISWQYPFVEGVTGILFALFATLALTTGETKLTVVWLLFLVALFIVIAVYDARNMEIPVILLLFGLGGAILYGLTATIFSGAEFFASGVLWREMLLGGGIAALLFYGLVFYSKETWMGMGDVWLAGIAGAAVGISALLLLLTLSFFLGALVGGLLLILGRKGMKSQIPFAPFLVAGTFVTLLLLLVHPSWLSLFLLPL